MHSNSYDLMEEFVELYLKDKKDLRVLDVGGSNKFKSYKILYENHKYKTLDRENADYNIKDYNWPNEIKDSFDVVISGQTLEHDPFFWLTLKNMSLTLKKNGLMCIVVPGAGQVHKYPVDCYRFYEDCLDGWAEWMNLKLIDNRWDTLRHWKDLRGIFKKGE